MDCSIIITTYNDSQFLPKAIESALAYSDDVIVVDDHSDIPPVLDYPITYIRHGENKRLSAARNTGIAISKHDRYLTLDADDYLLPGVKKLFEMDADIVYGNLSTQSNPSLKPNPSITLEHFRWNNQIYPTSLVKKSVWEALGGYWDPGFSWPEDWDFWARACKSGFWFQYVGADVYFKKERPGSEWDKMKHNFDYFRWLINSRI